MNYVNFIYEKDGKLYGFAATKENIWPQKTLTKDTMVTTLYPVNNLKFNLKRLLKMGVAKKIGAGTTKAIAVPQSHALGLCLPVSQDISTS